MAAVFEHVVTCCSLGLCYSAIIAALFIALWHCSAIYSVYMKLCYQTQLSLGCSLVTFSDCYSTSVFIFLCRKKFGDSGKFQLHKRLLFNFSHFGSVTNLSLCTQTLLQYSLQLLQPNGVVPYQSWAPLFIPSRTSGYFPWSHVETLQYLNIIPST